MDYEFENSDRTLTIDDDGAWHVSAGSGKVMMDPGSGQVVVSPGNGQVIVQPGNGQVIIQGVGRGQVIVNGKVISP